MDTNNYWGSKKIVSKSGLRYSAGTAQVGDVVIIQPRANIYVWDIRKNKWIKYGGNVGNGAGHIGFVVAANYVQNYPIENIKLNGWKITLQSANWDNNNNFADGSDWSINGGWITLNNCTNVSHSWIFIPNKNPVSFWRPYPSNIPDENLCDGDPGVYLYENINFLGRCTKFTTNSARPENWFVGNDKASSLQIIGNWLTTLYEHADFKGVSSTFTYSDPDLRNDAVGNDRASSIAVQMR